MVGLLAAAATNSAEHLRFRAYTDVSPPVRSEGRRPVEIQALR